MIKILFLFSFCFIFISSPLRAQKAVPSNKFEILSGVRNSNKAKTYWDKKYSKEEYVFGKSPAKFLSNNFHYLPMGAKLLDMGMGEGRNAVFLARKGYKVTGIDISSVAVKKARFLAKEFGVRINTVVASLKDYRIPPNSLDAIICFYYVDRTLHDRMLSWLKPGGILVYESYTDHQKKVKGFEKYDKRYMLRPGELLSMFPKMAVLKYEEPQHLSEYTASIILQKPYTSK